MEGGHRLPAGIETNVGMAIVMELCEGDRAVIEAGNKIIILPFG